MWLYIVCLAIMVILSVKFHYDKRVTYIALTFLAIIFVAVYGNADTEAYYYEYTNMLKPNWNDTEPLWMFIQYVFRTLKIPFWGFRLFIFFSGILLIFKTLSIVTKDKNIILLFYMIYPFMLDMVQIRNFLAMSILIYAIKYLIEERTHNLIKYIFLILAASLIHNVFIIYLVLIFIRIVKKIDYRFWIVVILLMFVGIMMIFDNISSIVLFLFGNYHGGGFARKYVMYGLVSNEMMLGLFGFYLLGFLGSMISHRIFVLAERTGKYDSTRYRQNDLLIKCFVMLSLFYMLNLFSMDFARIYRNVLILVYGVMWEASKYTKNKFIMRVMLFIMALYGCWLFTYYAYPDSVFWPAIQNNYFFEWFNFE